MDAERRSSGGRLRPELDGAYEELLAALYPPRCRLCGAAALDALACGEHLLPAGLSGARCELCSVRLPPGLRSGYRCAACRRRRPGFRALVALGDYQAGGLREWILALKHGGRRELAEPLGRLLGVHLLDAVALAARRRGPAADVLVPVPLHPGRRLERGYDQALLLAHAVGGVTGWPVRRWLTRRRATPPQGGALGASRRANVRGAFGLRRFGGPNLSGPVPRVWLVDDVVTSGATASECARELRRAGARNIAVLALARAGAQGHRGRP